MNKRSVVRLGSPPSGDPNWSLRLLVRKVVELSIVETVSHDPLYRTLKKTHDQPQDRVLGSSLQKQPTAADDEFTACLEDVLEVSEKPSDLTTYKRDDVRRMLPNVINPSAGIREGFETLIAVLNDGRVITGFLVEQDPQSVSLRSTDGQTVALARADIDELIPQKNP